MNGEELLDKLDELFPKGKCKERGQALVLYSFFKMSLTAARVEMFEEVINALRDHEQLGPWKACYLCGRQPNLPMGGHDCPLMPIAQTLYEMKSTKKE